jgi:L-threonylcarbamoyladenylate synthase
MYIYNKDEALLRKNEILSRINSGQVFIYPTDTIYGLGCSAKDSSAIKKIRQLKNRPSAPLSVWAPGKGWILENCQLTKKGERWLAKLPGNYTLLLPLRNSKAVAPEVNPGTKILGIRIPDHWMKDLVQIPIITTSANKSGEPFMTSLDNLDEDIKRGIDFIIYDGPINGRPSKVIDVEKDEVKER